MIELSFCIALDIHLNSYKLCDQQMDLEVFWITKMHEWVHFILVHIYSSLIILLNYWFIKMKRTHSWIFQWINFWFTSLIILLNFSTFDLHLEITENLQSATTVHWDVSKKLKIKNKNKTLTATQTTKYTGNSECIIQVNHVRRSNHLNVELDVACIVQCSATHNVLAQGVVHIFKSVASWHLNCQFRSWKW